MTQSQERTEAPAKTPGFLAARFGGLLDRWQPPADFVLVGTALFVGIFTGIGAVLFRYLIRGVGWVGYQWIPAITSDLGSAYIIFVPALGGMLVGLLVYFVAREVKGSGVPDVMEAVALKGGRIRPRVAVVKALASALTIGSGGSAGREGPIVQIGSTIGSTVAQLLKLSDERRRNLVAGGAAAGIAATFNAPIAGVLFALEVILGRFSVRYFSTVVVAAVAASIIGRAAFGDSPAFNIPVEYGVNTLWEFLFYPILGVLAAVVGVVFARSLYWTQDLFDNAKRIPAWLRPAVGGAMLGALAFAYPLFSLAQPINWTGIPHIFNVGYEVIESALANELVFSAALILLIAKILATCLTLGSGGSGGVMAPSLFMGAMLGTAFELSINRLFPGVSAPAGAYALVGMAAVFAASVHAPMTAVITLFEMTGDYRIILPLMLTVMVATLVSQLMLRGESIFTLKLSQRGIRLERGRDTDIMHGVTVDEVMATDASTVPDKTTLEELAELFASTRHHGLMVLDNNGKLCGIVTLTDLERGRAEERPGSDTVETIATGWPHLKVAFPDETMGDALTRMGSRGLGRLPVVAREDPYRLLGVLRREGISRAYNLALSRRTEHDQQAKRAHDFSDEAAEFVDIRLVAGDNCVGKTVAEFAPSLPKDCVLVSVLRDGHVIIPHGDTVLQADDQVTAYVRNQDAKQLFHCLHDST
jgi:CIC family chloride channel protein